MSPLFGMSLLDGYKQTAHSDAALEFRAHLRKESGVVLRSVGPSLLAGARGLGQRLHPPAPVDLEPIPEDTFGSGWTPGPVDEEN